MRILSVVSIIYQVRFTCPFPCLQVTNPEFVTGLKNQEKHVSWWPKQVIWQKSGLNFGYWTTDCEAWYQRRLQDIKNGSAKLYGSREWRDKMQTKGWYKSKL